MQTQNFPSFSYIGSVNSSAKIAKGEQFGIDTYIVYLAPWKLSGHNTCSMATGGTGNQVGCVDGCLFSSGQAIMNSRVMAARIERTKYFYNNRESFCAQLFAEITLAKVKAERKGHKFTVRLNGTSDLSPELFTVNGVNILQAFPDVEFYDYTKVLNRSRLLSKYPNYKLTFSFSGYNWSDCMAALNMGINVAAVFNIKKGMPLPESLAGYPVIDGDINDYRAGDSSGVIVGLRFKRIKDAEMMRRVKNSPFVINPAKITAFEIV
jgi:hypothetical protein